MIFRGLTVTQRVKSVSQPEGGFVPESLFITENYGDFQDVYDLDSAFAPIQGLAVDYLTRFMISGDVEHAFDISIKGAQIVDGAYENSNELDKIMSMLSEIKGLDRNSIFFTCKVVCYDSAYRMGLKFFQSPDDLEVNEELINNIKILVERSLSFVELVKPIISDGFTFKGGYTGLVAKGDGDFLTKDMLIDFKTSKEEFSPYWSLQVLMYYLLGIHSVHPEFQRINKLCIFNPLKNRSYICEISSISNEVLYTVSHYVIGYKMLGTDCSTWRDVNGTDEALLQEFIRKNFGMTDFKVDNYGDGIFDISLDDYWTFLKTNLVEYKNEYRPIFKNTACVKLIKHNGYFMFVSVSPKGKYSILHGGKLHSMKFSLEYYYDNIERYAQAVIAHFSKYWDALRDISSLIQSLEPTEKFLRSKYAEYLKEHRGFFWFLKKSGMTYDEWYETRGKELKLTGRCHGCIVDVDFLNHIYLNPCDGKVTAYNASSMYDKNVYKNTRSLIAAQRPEMLPSFDKKVGSCNSSLLITKEKDNSLILADDMISKEFAKDYSYDMYEWSNKLKPLQYIYDMKLVQIWYDEILCENELLIEDKYQIQSERIYKRSSDYVGQSKEQKGNCVATIIAYRSYNDIDVQFEDGYTECNTSITKWSAGRIVHPSVKALKEQERAQKAEKKPSKKEKYIGMRKQMKCGQYATVIDYQDCKNLTIQFDDGLIKTGVRSDHFTEGRVSRN